MEMFRLTVMSVCKFKSSILNYLSRWFSTQKIVFYFIHLKCNIQEYLTEFIENAKNIEHAKERILNFLTLTTLIISNDLDHYMLAKFKGTRLAKVFAYRVILVISVLRFTVSALINDPMISALMADATHMFGYPKLICIFTSTLSMSFFAITIVSGQTRVCASLFSLGLLQRLSTQKSSTTEPNKQPKACVKNQFDGETLLLSQLLVSYLIHSYCDYHDDIPNLLGTIKMYFYHHA